MITKLTQLSIACVMGCSIGAAIGDEHHHMHRFPKDVDAFHAVLAPIWHSAPGKERLQAACAKANEMEGLAKRIRSTDATELLGAVGALKTKCQGNQESVEAAFGDVHEAFHHLIEHKPAGKAR